MRECKQSVIDANQQGAGPYVGTKLYAKVPIIITATTTSTITFTATDTSGRTSSFTARWGEYDDMFAACPSNVPCTATLSNAGPVPGVGATGDLYLSDAYFSKNNVQHTTPKWPRSLGDDTPVAYYAPLQIWPTTVVLTGVEVENTEQFVSSIDLLDPEMAQPGQQLTIQNGVLTIQASKLAFAKFGVKWDATASLSAALKVISANKRDADALAQAWQVVADASRQIPVLADAAKKQELSAMLASLNLGQ